MTRGVVMELLDERTAVVLTSEFTFVRVVRQPYMAIGAELDEFFPLVQKAGWLERLRQALFNKRYTTIGVAIASLFVAAMLVFSQSTAVQAAPYLYLSLDVNPSIELTVNQSDHVVQAVGLDADGAKVLKALTLSGEELPVAIKDYIQYISKQGYLTKHSDVVIVGARGQLATKEVLSNMLSNVRTEISATLMPTKIPLISLVVTKNFFNQAVADHVSPGRLALYVEAKRRGQSVSWQDIVQGHLAQAVGGPVPLQQLLHVMQHDATLNAALHAVVVQEAHHQPPSQPVQDTVNGVHSVPLPPLPSHLLPLPRAITKTIQVVVPIVTQQSSTLTKQHTTKQEWGVGKALPPLPALPVIQHSSVVKNIEHTLTHTIANVVPGALDVLHSTHQGTVNDQGSVHANGNGNLLQQVPLLP